MISVASGEHSDTREIRQGNPEKTFDEEEKETDKANAFEPLSCF
ncbi:MAG: hypothetical protein ACKOW8_10025 [Flavobacteriales bacterium]